MIKCYCLLPTLTWGGALMACPSSGCWVDVAGGETLKRRYAGAPQALRSLEQAALLAAAVQAQRASAADELRAWQAAPFLDAVLRQRRTRFLLRGAARLLRCALHAQCNFWADR